MRDWDDRTPVPSRFYRPKVRHGCGGWAAYEGPCGATDCPTCHPESVGRCDVCDGPLDDEGRCEECAR